jgi:hypothetical protein
MVEIFLELLISEILKSKFSSWKSYSSLNKNSAQIIVGVEHHNGI